MTETQAVSHRDCDLGKWLYANGMKKYGAVAEMKTLEKEHINLHETVKRIIELKHAGDAVAARQELEKLDQISQQVVALLTEVEHKLVDAS